MTGTEATALRVFKGMTCRGNSEKPLSTVHCTGQKVQSEQFLYTSMSAYREQRSSAHLSGASQGADRRHDVNRLDSPGLPLLVQNVGPLHDFLAVGVEHALQEELQRSAKNEPSFERW